MKRILSISLCLLMCLSLCACGENKYEKYADLFDLLEQGDYEAAKDKIDQMENSENNNSGGLGNLGGGSGILGGGNDDGNAGSNDDPLAKAKAAILGEWIGKGEQRLHFRDDGTCSVNEQSMKYTVEQDTMYYGGGRIYLGESKETAVASLTLRLVVNNMYIVGATGDQNGEYRLVSEQKGTLLTADTYFDTDTLQRVELSSENWEQYFELKETASVVKNDFGEIERFSVSYHFQVKEEYRNKINTTLSFGSVGTMQANGIFSCTITDMEKATYQINHAINPSDLAEEVDSFSNLGNGMYGAIVSSSVMYCSDGSSYRPETMTGTLLSWPDQLSVNRIVGTLYISK